MEPALSCTASMRHLSFDHSLCRLGVGPLKWPIQKLPFQTWGERILESFHNLVGLLGYLQQRTQHMIIGPQRLAKDLEIVACPEGNYHLAALSPSEAQGTGLKSPTGQLERTRCCPARRTPGFDSHTDVGHFGLEWLVTSSSEPSLDCSCTHDSESVIFIKAQVLLISCQETLE